MKKKDLEREYQKLMGHEPPLDDTDDAWQWDYRGSRDEREALAERMGLEPDPPAEQEESLF